jgi:hypothetical protein
MADNEVKILVQAVDNATKTLKNVESSVKKTNNTIQRSYTELASKVFLAQQAFSQITRAIKPLVEASLRQQDAINRLNTQLDLNGEFTREASRELQDFASELQKVTRFGDEATLEQLTFAMAMGATKDQAKDLVVVAADFATQTGKSYNETVRQIAKTLGGFAGELGEVIPELKDLTREQLRNGDAISLLGQRYRGAAQRDVEGFSGSMSQLQNSFGDLLESLGDLITTSQPVIDAIRTATQAFSDLADEINRFNDAGPMEKFSIGAREAAKSYGGLIAGIAGAGPIYDNLIQKMDEVNNRVGEMMGVDQNFGEAKTPFTVSEDDVQKTTANIESIGAVQDAHVQEYLRQQDSKKDKHRDLTTQGINDLQLFFKTEAEGSKAAAIAYKGIQLGRAIIGTAEGITEAFPNLPLMAFVAATGAAQIATISSQGFAEGTDTVPANLTPGEMVVPRTFAEAIRRGDLALSSTGTAGASEINIYIQGGIRNDGASVEEMAEQLGFEFERQLRSAR